MNAKITYWTRNFVLLFIVQLLDCFSFNVLNSQLGIFVKHLGGNNRAVGFCASSLVLAMIICRPLGGMLLDRYDRGRVLLFSQCGLAISLYLYCFVDKVPGLIAIRALHGIFWAVSATACSTIAAGIIPQDRLGEGIGMFTLSVGIAMGFAPSTGFFLADRYSFQAMFLTNTGAVLLALIFTAALRLPAAQSRPSSPEPSPFLFPSALPSSALILLVGLAGSSISAFLPLYAQGLGARSAVPFFTSSSIMVLLSRPLAGRLVDRFSAVSIAFPSFFIYIVAYELIVCAPFHEWMPTAAVLHGLAFGSLLGSLQVLSLRRANTYQFGAATATFFLGLDIGNGIGPLVAGLLADRFNYRTMYSCMALALFFGLVCSALLILREKKNATI